MAMRMGRTVTTITEAAPGAPRSARAGSTIGRL